MRTLGIYSSWNILPSIKVEVSGGFSVHKHLIAMHTKTLVLTFKCLKCKRIRTKVVRHSPIG
jgi:hypothetical protein